MIKWKFSSKYDFSDKNFARIYSFFVIESPVNGVSVRGITFKELKINKKSLVSRIKKRIPNLMANWNVLCNKEIESSIKDFNIYNGVSLPLEIAIHNKKDNSKVDGLYYAIRCALAHGAFSIHRCKGDKYYLLENKDKGILKGRIILKEKSLLELIDVIDEFNK